MADVVTQPADPGTFAGAAGDGVSVPLVPVVATRPASAPPRPYHFPRFDRRTLDNGATLIVAPVPKLPIATVLVLIEAGAVAEPRGQEGVAQLTAHTITEGTVRYDGEALTNRLERLGTAIDASADWDGTTLTFTVLTDKLRDAFVDLAEVLTAPTFPEAAVERIKGEQIATILQVESEPRELADEMFNAFAYADASRFSIPVSGTKHSVQSLTRTDVLNFYRARYHPDGATIIVVGDVETDAMEQLVYDALAGTSHRWGEAPLVPTPVIDAPARLTRALQIVHKGDTPQSELRLGHVSVPRSHPDYFKLTVANAILGGLFSSRINLNLREAHGYTYGAHSEFDWRRAASPFLVSTAVASNVTAAALQETLYEIGRMRRDEVLESELSLATSYLDGVFPIRFETTIAIASALATLVMYDLPADWYDSYRAHIRAVTTGDVLHMMRTHVDPDRLQIVVVGNAAVVQESLDALRLGPVSVREVDPAMGRAVEPQ